MFFTYLYLLRIPILGGVVLGAIAPLALWKGSNVTTLLEGMFDLDWWRVGIVAGVVLLTGGAAAVCSELVLRYGSERFAIAPLPDWWRRTVWTVHRFGVDLVVDRLTLTNAAAYMFCAAVMLGGLVYAGDTVSDHLWRLLGVGVGGAAFLGLVAVAIFCWANSPPYVVGPVTALFRWTPAGYLQSRATKEATLAAFRGALRKGSPLSFVARRLVDPTSAGARELLLPGHGFNVVAVILTLAVYVALGIAKTPHVGPARPDLPPIVPTLAFVLVLLALVTYLFSGIAFLLDRFRVPFLLPLALLMVASADWPQSDHVFRVTPPPSFAMPSPSDVLRQGGEDSAVVVATSGGGIQASAWTASVLAQLHREMKSYDFARRIRLISSVSGGSVGAMYFLAAYRDGTIDASTAKDEVFQRASASSLDDIAWGLVYPDLLRLVAPFAVGRFDRGWAAERAWLRVDPAKSIAHTLGTWRRDTADGVRPAVIFNSTAAENGERVVFETSELRTLLRGRTSFYTLHRTSDVPIVTAVRLSATFPYVSPAARAQGSGPLSTSYHFIDGGYYENYGVASVSDWLREAMPEEGTPQVTRILVVQIRGSIGQGDDPASGRRRGFFYQLLVPPLGLAGSWATAQISRNNAELRLLCEVALRRNVRLDTAIFQYPYRDTPLSWHLTRRQRDDVWAAFEQSRDDMERVRRFLSGRSAPEGCAQFAEPGQTETAKQNRGARP